MPITGIWLDSRLKDIFIESKNTRIGVRMRNLWSSEVGVQQGPHYCGNPHNSVPKRCRNILATPIPISFQPKFVLEVSL